MLDRLEEIVRDDAELAGRLLRMRAFSRRVRTREYHLTNACNLRCKGCWFFEYDYDTSTREAHSLESWRALRQGAGGRRRHALADHRRRAGAVPGARRGVRGRDGVRHDLEQRPAPLPARGLRERRRRADALRRRPARRRAARSAPERPHLHGPLRHGARQLPGRSAGALHLRDHAGRDRAHRADGRAHPRQRQSRHLQLLQPLRLGSARERAGARGTAARRGAAGARGASGDGRRDAALPAHDRDGSHALDGVGLRRVPDRQPLASGARRTPRERPSGAAGLRVVRGRPEDAELLLCVGAVRAVPGLTGDLLVAADQHAALPRLEGAALRVDRPRRALLAAVRVDAVSRCRRATRSVSGQSPASPGA